MTMFDQLTRGLNQVLGSAPPEHVQEAATSAIQQVDSQEYAAHAQPGVGGTDPFGALSGAMRSGLAQNLLGSLFNRGVGQQQISQGAGVSTLDPSKMSPQDLAALAQWIKQNHPEAMGQVAQQYQQQPDILQSLLGNKALMLLAAGLGAKWMADHNGKL